MRIYDVALTLMTVVCFALVYLFLVRLGTALGLPYWLVGLIGLPLSAACSMGTVVLFARYVLGFGSNSKK